MKQYFVSDNLANEQFQPLSKLPLNLDKIFELPRDEREDYLKSLYGELCCNYYCLSDNDILAERIKTFFYRELDIYNFYLTYADLNIDYYIAYVDSNHGGKLEVFKIKVDSNLANKIKLDSISLRVESASFIPNLLAK